VRHAVCWGLLSESFIGIGLIGQIKTTPWEVINPICPICPIPAFRDSAFSHDIAFR
jgi:hypothetical protein